MIRFDHRQLPGVFALTLLLGACGKAAPEHPPAAPAEHAFVAIARGKVDVEGGIVRVVATRDGVVSQVHGAVGDMVKPGDVLVEIDPVQAKIAVDMAKAELAQADAQRALLRAKLPGTEQRASRVGEASQAGAATGQAADDAKQALAELNAEIAVADAGSAAARQKIRQAQYEVDVRSLRAPVAARIVAHNVHVGDAVSAQVATALMELLPDRPRIVRAELNEGFVAKIKVGMSAQVYSEADASKTYPARVARIGDVFGPSKFSEEGQESVDARDVECILDLPESDLRVGQRVQVRFLPASTP
ncbi:MAG: HlyD family efflux transporter periplasmic adaptor subunit [Rudaea sp.]|nr:HlyD family efflux transporter periplasmic adaptor subunit [Rudaea sp.]